MEGSSSSKRAAAAGGHDDRNPVRNGVKVDDEREYQPVREDTQGGESI